MTTLATLTICVLTAVLIGALHMAAIWVQVNG